MVAYWAHGEGLVRLAGRKLGIFLCGRHSLEKGRKLLYGVILINAVCDMLLHYLFAAPTTPNTLTIG